MMSKFIYAVQDKNKRKGEFEFNCNTQGHTCASLEKAEQLITDLLKEPTWEDMNTGENWNDYKKTDFVIYKLVKVR